jgi:hypothetical protein
MSTKSPGLFPAFCLALLLFVGDDICVSASEMNETERIAQLIFHNECAGKESCLTSWNKGEEFASLGIGHFIWYPRGTAEPDKHFSESFPSLMAYLQSRGVKIPDWILQGDGSPWPDRKSFIEAQDSPEMHKIRQILIKTMPLQADFMKKRLDYALSRMLQTVPESARAHLKRQYQRVAAAPMGMYALMDYVNFKGEGTNPKERYQGHGWGLLQVLGDMQEGEGLQAIRAFSDSADRILTRRITLSPPPRNEERWLPGWRKRLHTYIEQAELQQSRL